MRRVGPTRRIQIWYKDLVQGNDSVCEKELTGERMSEEGSKHGGTWDVSEEEREELRMTLWFLAHVS